MTRHPDDGLLSIGHLAAASGLSPKALRLYDESGLLPPRAVDPFTGYRSYSGDQVERARLIAALRGIGMGLARIQVVCDLEPAAAATELWSWWLQEEADSASRRDAVGRLVRHLEAPRPQEGTMNTDSFDPAVSRSDSAGPHPARNAAAPISAAVAAHRGLERPAQQDAVVTRELPGGAQLIAAADGFGADDGLAARVLDAFTAALVSAMTAGADGSTRDAPPGRNLAALETAWAAAEQIIPAVGETAGAASPGSGAADGTTLTAAVLAPDGAAYIAHIGDTRAVLGRDGHLHPITQDHTHVRSLVAAGRLTADEAEAHPDRVVLNRALASGAPTAPDLLVRRLKPRDLVLIASDGLHAVVKPSRVAGVLTGDPGVAAAGDAAGPGPGGDELQSIVDQLVDEALSAGGPDNVVVALAQLGDGAQ